jgi:hypothetical protein
MQTVKVNKQKVTFKLTTTVLNQTATETGVSILKVQEKLGEQNLEAVKWLLYYGFNAVAETKTTPETVDAWLDDLATFTEVWYLMQEELEPMGKILMQLVEKKQKREAQK